MEIEPGDILMCTVEKIIGTNVFVEIEGTSKKGTIILSEISAGRIRNLRDYVVPKKIIACKVLRVLKDHIELSLRRVKEKERKEVFEKKRTEKSYENVLKSVLKEKGDEIIKKIKENFSLQDFMERAKENPSLLKKIAGKTSSEKIIEILKKQKKKSFEVKRTVKLTSQKPNGLDILKKVLERDDSDIRYLAAGVYSIQVKGDNLKNANQKLKEITQELENKAKEGNFEFS